MIDASRLQPSADPSVECEVVPTTDIAEGDRVEFVGFGIGYRRVESVEADGESILVVTLDGEPWDATRGKTSFVRARRYGQVVRRAL